MLYVQEKFSFYILSVVVLVIHWLILLIDIFSCRSARLFMIFRAFLSSLKSWTTIAFGWFWPFCQDVKIMHIQSLVTPKDMSYSPKKNLFALSLLLCKN
jgi:hypothetical protein